MTFKNTLIILLLIAAAIFCFGIVADDSEARLCVWDGGDAGALASTAANWDTDTAPVAGDDILFDGLNATGDDPCTWDLATNSFGTFTIAAGYTGTITQSSDMYIAGYSQAGGTFTPVNTKTITCSGNFVRSGGVFTANVANIIMTGESKIITLNCAVKSLRISGNTELGVGTLTIIDTGSLIVDSNKTLDLKSFTLAARYYASIPTIQIDGEIVSSSTGYVRFDFYNTDRTFSFIPNLNCAIVFNGYVPTANRIVTIAADVIHNYGITVLSGDAVKTVTLDLAGYDLTCTSLTVGPRGILRCGEGTITCKNLTSTSGTIIPETATWVFVDHGVMTCTNNQDLYNIYVDMPVTTTNEIRSTNETRLINIPLEYYVGVDVYKNGIYAYTVVPTGDYYSYGARATPAGLYTYIPDIKIVMGDWWQDIDFTYRASINVSLPVTYNITGTAADWLSINEGVVSGIPPASGTYTYTITATHSSGSLDTKSGTLVVLDGAGDVLTWNDSMTAGLLLCMLITIIIGIGYFKEIPLLQLIGVGGLLFSLIVLLRIEHFAPFLLIFILVDMVLFVLGMVRYKRG